MDGLILIGEAVAAGLTVRADGNTLIVRGPKKLEAIAHRLLLNKALVLAALRSTLSPCSRCGCIFGWQTMSGRIACVECERKPPTAELLRLVDGSSGSFWRPCDREHIQRAPGEIADGEDPWGEADRWCESTPICTECKSAEGWVDALDRWHCWKCCPPFRSEKLLNDRERILREAWDRMHRRHGGRE
jgi:hypothetical protein